MSSHCPKFPVPAKSLIGGPRDAEYQSAGSPEEGPTTTGKFIHHQTFRIFKNLGYKSQGAEE